MQRLGGFIDFVPVDSVTRPSQDFREFVVTHSAESSRTISTTETRSFIVSLRIPAQSPHFHVHNESPARTCSHCALVDCVLLGAQCLLWRVCREGSVGGQTQPWETEWGIIAVRRLGWSNSDSERMTGNPNPTRHKNLQLLIDGMEAIDHEAQTNFQKETHHKIRPALARSRARQICSFEQSQFPRRAEGISPRDR